MKRWNQGYVLALVLVVTLLLSSVASLLTVSVVRNIQAGGSNFAELAETETLNGMIEQCFAHLKYNLKYDEANPLDIETHAAPNEARAYMMEAFNDLAGKLKDAQASANPKATLTIQDIVQTVLDGDNGKYCYFFPVQVSLYADETHTGAPLRSAAAVISVSLTYTALTGEEGDDPTYWVSFDSVEYASYQSP